MPSIEGRGTLLERAGERLWFCSEFCRQEFLKHPRTYGAEPDHELPAVDMATRRIAYFTMEVALKSEIPTYSGGLGVLAGDTLRSCADLAIPIVAVSLVHRRGYFHQELRGCEAGRHP